jgi:chemotaxis protein methyltransferase CheR
MTAHEEHFSSADYARLRELIYRTAGIALGADRKTMLGARITRRLKALNLSSHAEYCRYLFGAQGQRDEIVHLIDVVTTNKTDFFREPAHFDYLVRTALPEITASDRGSQPILLWSAGCSTGEEPYTLAMVLGTYAESHPGFRFRILATDISTSVLERAQTAVYTTQVVAPVPAQMRQKYLMRSRKPGSHEVRIVPELRRLVEFRRLNFMDADFGVTDTADAIFCRNVLIYFDRPTQERILQKLIRHLAPGGYMFVGHAETLHEMQLPLTPVAPALYRRTDG